MRAKPIILLTVAVVSASAAPLAAQTVTYDKTIQAAVLKKTGEKIDGELYRSIDYDDAPIIVTLALLKHNEKKREFRRPVEPATIETEKKLPRISENEIVVDNTVTGSIPELENKPDQRRVWDKFDRYGNPIVDRGRTSVFESIFLGR
ncbi:MAG: hypothetical protein AAGF54_05590 [Pseudomonadota bacterium]